jgi:glucose/arabinose dehydrogenase
MTRRRLALIAATPVLLLRTGRLWSTEMGPRGGDEFNLLRPGKNYGRPITSNGVNYDGTPVAWGKELGADRRLRARAREGSLMGER